MEDPSNAVLPDNRRESLMTAVNVSQGGLYIKSLPTGKENELYRISIDLPNPGAKVTAFGEVVWSDGGGGGVHFLAIHEEQESHLKDFVHSSVNVAH